MALPAAQPAEVLRATQKDDYYQRRLAAEIVKVLPPRRAGLAAPAASALYGACTTLRDLQTLGEEYSGIVQVDDTYTRLPRLKWRILNLILSIWGEDFVKKLILKAEKNVTKRIDLTEEARSSFIIIFRSFSAMLPQFERIHRAICYLKTGSLQVSKAVTGINYVQIKPAPSYFYAHLRLLGAISLIHALISCGQCFYRIVKSAEIPGDNLQLECDSTDASTCKACLSSLGRPCALPCGHVFCLGCAYGWLQSCALCRTPFVKSRVVPLQNYVP